ncbi:MAG: hypothetical protein FK734_13935 [Asgard group archaeon]|nr:hypothetical protein [Asgard group archaeon]
MKSRKDILLEMFEDESQEVRFMLVKAKEVSPISKLTPDTRTILDLVNHIAQIPRIDIGIYNGELSSGELAHKMELELNRDTMDEAITVFDEGCKYTKNYFSKMTDEELTEAKMRPFYEPEAEFRSWAYFLPKLTTHLVLHKGILWSYLKLTNEKVNMFSYYGVDLQE